MHLNQIHCGPSEQLLAGFSDQSIDLVVTDPPYLCRYRDRTGRTIQNDDNAAGIMPVFDQVYRVLKEDSYCVSFYGWNAVADFTNHWASLGFKIVGQIVWAKSYASRVGHVAYHHESAFVLAKGYPSKPDQPMRDVQKWTYSGNRYHPTQKAVEVIAPLVQNFSKPGDVVLDPFAGVGTTPVAAALTQRQYVGVELDPGYCDIARRRLDGVHLIKGFAA